MVFWCNFDFAPFCLPEIDTHIWKQWGTGRQLADEQRSYCWVDVHRDSDSPSHSDGSALDNQSRKNSGNHNSYVLFFFFCCCCWISVTLPGLQLSQSSASFFTKGEGLPSSTAPLKVIVKRDDGIRGSSVTRRFWKQVLPMTSYSNPQKIKKTVQSYWKYMAVCQNLVPLVNIKIAGKWMFIPLKMYL